jgi:serine protease Do
MKTRSILATFISFLLSSTGVLIAGYSYEPAFLNESDKAQKPRADIINRNDAISNSRQTAITETVRIASPAIVGINVTEVRQVNDNPFGGFFSDPFYDQFFMGRRRNVEVQQVGSGFLISSDGYIVTNDHVASNAKKIVVTMTNGEKYDAKIIGSDPVTDVALLKIDGNNFPFLAFSNSDDIIIGEWSIAFGNPFGLFDNNAKPTVTVGVVSNSGVSFKQDNRVYKNMIQTDAAISSGNSGGPLLNARGEVIGVNTVIFSTATSNRGSGSIGIGFAVPINRVKKILETLKEEGKVDRNFTPGFFVRQIDDQVARYFQLEKKQGVVVVEVRRGTPGDKAGIEPGDIILEIDGSKIEKNEDLEMVIFDGVVGQTMQVLIDRSGETITKKLYLEGIKK